MILFEQTIGQCATRSKHICSCLLLGSAECQGMSIDFEVLLVALEPCTLNRTAGPPL